MCAMSQSTEPSSLLYSQSTSLAMRTTIQGLRMKFPSVKNVTTVTLQNWIDGGPTVPDSGASAESSRKENTKKLIIIDTRPELEYSVSHIAESINVNFETEDMDRVKKLMLQDINYDSPGVRVVLYCSVGYRSSVLADKLQQATKPDPAYKHWHFFNLEGSLFKWANENRPMVDQQGLPTDKIHPFNSLWGKLVDKHRWKSTP
ncbi:uncharacterized protein LOC110978656 isoform X2 [Acanthaster planci]|uniref:Uncharacterized protein LOC110978656 isoform X2 n=1 Tax=Acanthaster planci TaxID=133434 RepID=A0A8B7Y8E7_ACAPL|nr:uncharacterized protein LOC110978656 isoform X2 [Acanthaster planci]